MMGRQHAAAQKGEIAKIKEVMEQNVSNGMCTFDQYLMKLYRANLISEETVFINSDKPSEMKVKMQQAKLSDADAGGEGDGVLAAMDTSTFSLSE